MTFGALGMLLVAAVASAVLTWSWIAVARARRIEDHPGQRRLHTQATPRGGGVAVALVFVAGLGYVSRLDPTHNWLSLATGVGLFALVGLLDDLLPVPTLAKFAGQVLAAACLVIGGSQGWQLALPLQIALVVACAYVVNVWNFMDGSDGLVTVQAVVMALAIALWPAQDGFLSLAAYALAGACLGFLPFNFPSARVFLGDVGSHALGAAIFGLFLFAWGQGSIGWVQALLIGTVLLLDSGLTLFRRLVSGRRVWIAHREHLYQYAVRVGHSHAWVCICYGAVTMAVVALAMASQAWRSTGVTAGLLIFSWMSGSLVYLALRDRWLENTHRGRGNG